jgi:acetyl-CoA carboxylase carboxyltransferase component
MSAEETASPVPDLRSRQEAARNVEAPAHGRTAFDRPPVRDYINTLLDAGSFDEVGTLAHSDHKEHAGTTPGDGKVCGHGRIGGQPVTVAADEARVKRASTSYVGNVKVHRIFDQALAAGNPFIYLGQTGGARLPDCLGSAGHTRLEPMPYLSRRNRRIPMVTAIVGESFGGSSLVSALSDFTVQLRGSCLAISSPLVISEATGEEPTFDELGGVDVHDRRTGQIDRGAEHFVQAADLIREFLSYLPQNCWTPAPQRPAGGPAELAAAIGDVVPASLRRPYDMRRVIRRLVDSGRFLELRPGVGRGVLTGLATIGGVSVGLIASQPMHVAGAVTPKGCDKIVRLMCTCDAFGLPVLFVQDTPGFLVGTSVEHDNLVFKAMLMHQAVAQASVPTLTVIIRKSYGLATACLGGPGMGTDTVWAWPGAQIGFMDPNVAVRVLDRKELAGLDPAQRDAEVTRRAELLGQDNSVYGAAGLMRVDEVIEPAQTRDRIARRLLELSGRAPVSPDRRILATWPTSW